MYKIELIGSAIGLMLGVRITMPGKRLLMPTAMNGGRTNP